MTPGLLVMLSNITAPVNRPRVPNLKHQSELRKCACCLYRIGFGGKRIGRQLSKHPSLVLKWIRQSGLIDRSRRYASFCGQKKSPLWKKQYSDALVLRLVAEVHKRDACGFKKGDEATHWGNHPSLQMLAYYADHEGSKARARENAKRTWLKKRSDPLFRVVRVEATKRWKSKNKEKVKAWNLANVKLWRKKNPDKYRAGLKKRMLNPQYRAAKNIRSRVRSIIKGEIGIRFNELCGCNRAFLMSWLQSQFKPGMAWNNYGTLWHIDHKIPCAAFDLTDREQRKKCSHYSNLQPLWAEENIAKGDSIIPHQPELAIPLAA